MGRIVQKGATLLDMEGAAELLGISTRTVRRFYKDGSLERVPIPRTSKIYFREDKLLALKETLSIKSTRRLQGRLAQDDMSVPPKAEPPHLRCLRKWHPELFKTRP